MYHKWSIENNPLQTRASALMFSPARSQIRDLIEKELKLIIIKPIMKEEWGAYLQTLDSDERVASQVCD
jgi:hypothetical protein